MVAVQAELAKVGISKDRKNEQQNFRFRGIDDTLNVVCPILASQHVLMTPCYEDYPDVERVTGKGSTLIYSKVKGTFTFTSALDGSAVGVTTFGVAMDSGDKGMNKAMSAALKYALLQTFLVPTESNEDADSTTQEPSVPKPPEGFEDWFTDIVASADNGFDVLRVAWRESREEFRNYAMTFRGAEWNAAKKKATTAGKKKAE
jgi:ERF superfamily